MNSYLLEGIDFGAVSSQIDTIIKDNNFNDALTSNYDLEIDTLDKVLEDLDTYSFLSDKKIILVKNMDKLSSDDIYLEHLLKYLNNPNPDNLLIMYGNKFNNTLKVTKEFKKLCTFIEVKEDAYQYTANLLKDYKIDKSTINMIVDYSLEDISKIENECNKLKDYCYDSKVINKEDVLELVNRKLGDSKDLTFSFIRSLGEKDRTNALKKYKELLEYNIEPLALIGLVASQIRIIYQVKSLENNNLNNTEIATILGEKDFRIKKTREITKYYSERELLKLMIDLSDIDLKCKSSDVDPNYLIEVFLLNM